MIAWADSPGHRRGSGNTKPDGSPDALMALTEEQARVKAAYEAVEDVFPTAGYAYVLACRRQLPEIDSPPGS